MTYCYSGFDEAGLGPLLGPLSIVRCSLFADENCDLKQLFHDANIGVGDSKKIYSSGKIQKLEQLALGAMEFFSGYSMHTAADVFALLHEDPALRDEIPWMFGAEKLTLPLHPQEIVSWQLNGVQAAGMDGCLLHPRHINQAYAQDINKSELETRHIMDMASRLPQADSHSISIDRLGGRIYYAPVLSALADNQQVNIIEEEKRRCAYSYQRQHAPINCEFLVKGEDKNPLIAAASCIAKYSRELHIILLNNYWSGQMPWLKKTAGYPQDAKRWIYQIGEGYANAHRHELIRGNTKLD